MESQLFRVVGGEFASLVEPTDDVNVADGMELTADGPEQIGSERQKVPCDPKRKLKLPIIRSVPWSRLSLAGSRAGGCG
jgi:hypothetical protein